MRKKWISCILAAVTLLYILVVPVMAEELTDESILMPVETAAPGSITIQLEDTVGNHPKGGVSLAIAQVADVINGEFVLKEEYEGLGVDLNNIKNANALEHATEVLTLAGISTEDTVVTDDSGKAVISDLPVGIYLIDAVDVADYEYIAASLVSIPVFNHEDGTMVYDIDVFPKHSAIPQTPKTGDSSEIGQYAVVMFSVLTLAVGSGVILKRKKVNDNL